MSENEQPLPGTAPAAKLEKAGCGFRFSEGELREGIDFSGADQLLPDELNDDESTGSPASATGKDR